MLYKNSLFIMLAMFSSVSCSRIQKTIPLPEKKPDHSFGLDRRQQLLRKKLEKLYQQMVSMYEPVLQSYNQVIKATPAEYFFYFNKLKVTILTQMKENHFGYKSSFSKGAYNFFLPRIESFFNHENAIREFRHHVAPWNVAALNRLMKGVTDKELITKATDLRDAIIDIVSIMA